MSKHTHDNIRAATQWTDRLAMDMSAELAYGRKMRQLEKGKHLLVYVQRAEYLLSIIQAKMHRSWIPSGS